MASFLRHDVYQIVCEKAIWDMSQCIIHIFDLIFDYIFLALDVILISQCEPL